MGGTAVSSDTLPASLHGTLIQQEERLGDSYSVFQAEVYHTPDKADNPLRGHVALPGRC